MTPAEVMARVAATALTQTASQQTGPSGSISVPNSDGTRTVIGAVNTTGSTMATHVGDTTPPGVPTGITAWSGDGSVHVSWDGTLAGGIPADFCQVDLLVDGKAFATLASAGSVTYRGAAVGTTVSVSATSEDDACAADGTAAHNVSAACKAISVTVTDVAGNTNQHFWADADGAHVSSTGDHDTSGFHQLMTSVKNAFMHGTTELMTISDNLIELGKNSTDATIRFCGGLASIAGRTVTWQDESTHFVADIHSTYGAGLSCVTNDISAGEPFKAYMGVQTSTGWTDDTYGVCEMAGGTLLLTDPSISDSDATVGVPMKTLINVLSAADGVPLDRLVTVLSRTVLWTGKTSWDVSLSAAVSGFSMIQVIGSANDNAYYSPIWIPSPTAGAIVDISCSRCGSWGWGMSRGRWTLTSTGLSASSGNNGSVSGNSGGFVWDASDAAKVYIRQVIGWR